MNERMVTLDGTDYSLGPDFFVLATQNPIEQQGTYPLPEAQLDRFLFKLVVEFPSRDTEIAILSKHATQALKSDLRNAGIRPLVTSAALATGRALIDAIHLDTTILTYIVDLVRATRSDPDILYGASTRAADAVASAVRVRAAFEEGITACRTMSRRCWCLPCAIASYFRPRRKLTGARRTRCCAIS